MVALSRLHTPHATWVGWVDVPGYVTFWHVTREELARITLMPAGHHDHAGVQVPCLTECDPWLNATPSTLPPEALRPPETLPEKTVGDCVDL